MPPELKFLQLEKGEAIVFSTADMAAIKWKDKKCCFINNYAFLRFCRNGKNKYTRYTREKILKPSVVIDYNKNMSGIHIRRSNVKQIPHYAKI